MKWFLKSFINGVLTIVPIGLVTYVVYKMFLFLDGLLGNVLKPYLDENYIPGIGLLATIVLLTVLGWLSTKFFTGTIIRIVDILLQKIPFVKTIYSVIKDTIHSFLGEKKSFSKVALVKMPGTTMKSLGFITTENLADLHNDLQDHVAVYVPQTFQVAGVTFLIPKKDIEILDIKSEEAMKFILSGGMTTKKEK
ncbi:DUF502 domain-containing protein [Rossellomorea aquimaris]|jgi:uncharacterized membrane protein|uniref:DUF502 domain-containing protein n=1 Tax=Rossellomorea aquimaris TaxID=189382 RepID=A0A5D4TSF4_9BACI|nr:DUF502 domain-containing protein [Rossellomorea aquimaris]TYS77312.1 DUF502 domain-containing protein [Rossellomorea aquimaris]TYS86490.1 DUF502 domain-containing protein [Rossellomorea aquimaris]